MLMAMVLMRDKPWGFGICLIVAVLLVPLGIPRAQKVRVKIYSKWVGWGK